MADSTDALLQGKRSGFFLNDSLETDPSITLHENFFMIAEKGNPALPHKNDPTQSADGEQSERSYLNETIVIRDSRLRQMKSPFPYYAQEPFPLNVTQTNWEQKVKTLNAKLNSFYRKSLY